MNPYEFYTVWCLTLLAIVVLWASFCKLYIPLGIWQAVFGAYCGAAATGTLMVMAYRDDFIEKYLDDQSGHLKTIIGDAIFHYIPFILMVAFRKQILTRTFRHTGNIALMMSFVLILAFTYNVAFGTTIYPVPTEFAIGTLFYP